MKAVAITLVAGLALSAAGGAAPARIAVGLDEHPGVQVPLALRFTASDDREVALGDVLGRGRPAILVLAYARCTMLCSVVLHGLGEALRASAQVVGRDYDLVVVSIDPRETRDEAAQKRARLAASIPGGTGAARWLRGSPAAVRTLADTLGFRYAWDERTSQYAHPAVVFVLAPDGRVAEYVRGVAFPGPMLDDALGRARAGVITASAAHDLLECFHFQASLARYGARIQLYFRIGALAVMAILFGAVGGLVVWERRRGRS